MRLWTPAKAPEKEAPERSVVADKAPDAFRTISEVAEEMDLPQHVLRFWETRFTQIRPLKRGGGRRYYRPEDVDLLRGIKHLLYGEGYTIKGVQRILKTDGLKSVQNVWRDPGSVMSSRDDDAYDGVDEAGELSTIETPPWEEDEAARPASHAAPVDAPQPNPEPAPHRSIFSSVMALAEAKLADPVVPEPVRQEPVWQDIPSASQSGFTPASRLTLHSIEEETGDDRFGLEPIMVEYPDQMAHVAGPVETVYPPRVEPLMSAQPVSALDRTSTRLSKDDVRRLQATLFELLECQKMLMSVK